MQQEFSWGRTITALLEGESLSESTAAAAMMEIMEGAATPAQIAGFVVALRAKGETAAALVCAGAGVKVAKHGNRAASSRCGSADVLEAMGVKIDLPPPGVEECIGRAGIGFCFAPVFHPAMRHAGTPRRELGVATVFNFLGPLSNPAGAKRQGLGVSDSRMLERMVEALARLGSVHVVAFHGDRGLDELSTSGPSRVVELEKGEVREWKVDPAELGLAHAPVEAVAGGSPQENASAIRSVLEGDAGPRRDIVLLNAAAGLVAADRAEDLALGLSAAAEAIDSGAASQALERLISVSTSVDEST